MKNNRFLLWILIFFTALTLSQGFGKNKEEESELSRSELGMATNKIEYRVGKEIKLDVRNNTTEAVELALGCAEEEPLIVLFYNNGTWENRMLGKANLGVTLSLSKGELNNCPIQVLALEPETTKTITYKDFAYRVLGETGRYKIETTLTVNDGEKTFSSNEFTINPRGFWGNVWIEGIYKPILNTLIYLIEILPGHNLGLAIILLTLIIRTLLLVPSQRAMKSQKKMQVVQAKIEELKKKHKDNQQQIALETMALWKEHKVNPFGSCIMMFIQIPIMIALYYVVQSGLHPDKAVLLYSFIAEQFNFETIQTNFLGILELTKINFIVLPLIVGGLQFVQMQLAFARVAKKKAASPLGGGQAAVEAKKLDQPVDMQSQMEMANNMMKYVMPAMIAFFTASLPSGVGLYWATSTVYGIVQQWVINRQSRDERSESQPSVRVIRTS